MILYRYIVRELLITFIGVTLVLSLIYLGGLIIRFLPDVSSGLIPLDQFLPILGIKILEELILGVPFSFFLALVVAIGKLLSDSELLVAYACGLQRSKLMTIVVLLSIALSLLVGVVSVVLGPLAHQNYLEIMAKIEQESELNSIESGKLLELSSGGLVYAETGNNVDGFGNVSIINSTLSEYSVLNAKSLYESGKREDGKGKIVTFHDGIKTIMKKDSLKVQKTEFSEYGIHVKTKVVLPVSTVHALPVSVLWGSKTPTHIAELQWRISTPLMMLVLAVVAVAISRYKPRSGKYGRLMMAIAIYMVYSHLITNSKIAIAHETTSAIVGIWWVHLFTILIFISLFVYQERRPG